MSASGERIVEANGVELCVETFGDPTNPAILLIMGASASMDWWEDDFCTRLADGSRYVIRYDLRDTGRSVTYEAGDPPYTMRDLADDAAGLVEAFGLAPAHVVAMSMGGAIAQLMTLDHPDRVASLTLISTGPSSPGPEDPDLPAMSEETRARFADIEEPEWSDRDAVIDYFVQLGRASAGSSRPFDDAPIREVAGRAFDRTTSMASTMANHHAMGETGRWRDRLGEIAVPTLVIHGADDPVVPFGNALALVREIPGAELLILESTGHELPRAVWDPAVGAILTHTSGI